MRGAWLIGLLLSPPAWLQAASIELREASPVTLRTVVQPQAATSTGGTLRLQLQSGAGTQELLLTPHTGLGALATRVQGRATAYQGELAGHPGSWAALTQIGSRWTGLWFDGSHYFGIDDARSLAGISAAAARAAPDSHLVFRLTDLRTEGMTFGDDMRIPDAEQFARELVTELTEPLRMQALQTAAQVLPTKRLSVAVIADVELSNRFGAQTESNVLARLNTVDGYFANQVGVRLQSGSSTVLTSGDPVFTTAVPSDLLNQLRDYRAGSSLQRASGLSHLFTGRDLDGQTVGIAFVEGLCSGNFSASLSEARGSMTLDSLIAAHEIGHVFGAPHDGDAAQACASTPTTFLMAPQVNGSSTFSACSLEQIAPLLTRSCLAPADAADGTIEAPSDAAVALNVATDIVVGVRSVGSATLTGATLRITRPLSVTLVSATGIGATCSTTGQTTDCVLGSLAPNALQNVTLRVQSTTAGAASVQLSVIAMNDGLASNNSRTLRLLVAPGTDLALASSLDVSSVTVGGTVNATLTLDNRGPVDASDTRVVVTVPATLVLQQFSGDGITCATVTGGLTCGPQTLPAAGRVRVLMALRPDAAGNATFTAQASASTPELTPADNQVGQVVQAVAPQPQPPANAPAGGGGGGGGALSPVLLALQAALAAMAARRRGQRAAEK